MGGEGDVIKLQKSGVDFGLLFKDVEAGSGDCFIAKRFDKGGFIDNGAAGGVDENGGRLHESEFGGADEVAGFRGQRDMEADVVGFAKQLFLGHAAGAEFGFEFGREWGGVGIEDVHGETASAAGDGLSDAAHAEDAESAVVDVLADKEVDEPFAPFAGVNEGVALDDTAGRGHEEGEGEVGGGFGEDVGGIGDEDAAGGGGRDVDIVVADGDIGNDADAVELGEDGGREFVSELADDGLAALGALNQGFGGQTLVGIDIIEFAMGADESDRFGINAFGDEDFGLRHGT